MRNFARFLVLGSAAVVGVVALGSCSPSEEQAPGGNRLVFESVEEVADTARFAFTGVVGEGIDTSFTPEAEPYPGTDRTPSGVKIEADSVPVVEYFVSVVDPLSSPLEQDADTAVMVVGGEADESGVVPLERDEEYLFFVINETQDALYSLVGIDVGAFQAQSDGSYANPVGMVLEADEVEAYAECAATFEG